MLRFALSSALAFVFVAVVGRAPARACSPQGNHTYAVDSTLRATDSEAPTLEPITDVIVSRGSEPDSVGCLGDTCSVGGLGSIRFAALATDNATPSTSLGYRLSVVAGQPPSGFELRGPVSVAAVFWHETSDEEPFDVTFEVVALDKAGNESAPQTFRAQHAGAGVGCRIAAARSTVRSAIPAAILIAVAFARRKARNGVRS
jgi:hypothetical protein